LIFKIKIWFYEDNSRNVAPRQKKFGTMKDHGHTYKFCLNIYFIGRTFLTWRWWDFQTIEVDGKLATGNVGP
jgi:hypothetical protein